MEITEVKVFPVREEKLKAFVSVVFDQCFMVNDIKIIQGRQGMFISMPSRKKKNGEFKDVAHPLNNDTRKMIEAEVLTEYHRVLEERAEQRGEQQGEDRSDLSGHPPAAQVEEAKPQERRDRRRRRDREAEDSAPSGATPKVEALEADEDRQASPGAEEAAGMKEGEEETAEKTLEEVEEMHLRDSFWTVP